MLDRTALLHTNDRLKGGALASLTGGSPTGYYQRHPDPAQHDPFFSVLAERLAEVMIDSATLRAEIRRGHIRTDAFERLRHAGYLLRTIVPA